MKAMNKYMKPEVEVINMTEEQNLLTESAIIDGEQSNENALSRDFVMPIDMFDE